MGAILAWLTVLTARKSLTSFLTLQWRQKIRSEISRAVRWKRPAEVAKYVWSPRYPCGIHAVSPRYPRGIIRAVSPRYPCGIRAVSPRYPRGISAVPMRYPRGISAVPARPIASVERLGLHCRIILLDPDRSCTAETANCKDSLI